MADLIQELRHAVSRLRHRPAHTIAVVATLALGVGLTSAISSLIYTVVLAPTPYPAPDRLVQFGRVLDGRSVPQSTAAEVAELRAGTAELVTVGVSRFRDVALSESGPAERLRAVIVTGRTLGMLGIRPVLGRLPTEADDVPGGPCLTVLSHQVWMDRFGAAPDIIGRSARLDGVPCAVMAVMPDGFSFPAPYFAPGDLWLLAGPEGVEWTARTPGFLVFGRLAPGVDASTLQAALDVIAARSPADVRFEVTGWAAASRRASRDRLQILLAAVALVLVVACINVATLQLARNMDRRGELATRVALGATTGRLARLLIAEAVVLAAAGAAGAVLVASLSLELIVALRSFAIPRMEEVALDGVTLASCLALSVAAGAVTTWIPALGLSRLGAAGTLQAFSRGSSAGRGHRRLGLGFIALETALALILLTGAALLFGSYRQLEGLDPGFRVEGILSARVSPAPARYADDRAVVALYREIQERIADLPGVSEAALTAVPPGVGAGARQPFALVGASAPPDGWPLAVWRPVSDAYFRTLDIPLMRGDGFGGQRGASRVVVVNEAFVRRFLAEGEPLGRRLQRAGARPDDPLEADAWTVVGVAADAHEEYAHLPPPPAIYVRLEDAPPRSVAVLVRTVGAPLDLAGPVREAVAAIDPEQPLWGVRDLDYMVKSEYDLNRLGLTLLGLFAAASLLLAIAGVYGVVTQSVGRRLREMAIRTALGARRGQVFGLLLGDLALFALLGIAGGLALLRAFGDRLGALTPGWIGLDLRVLGASALAVLCLVVCAALLPAHRAAAAEPASVLHED